MHRRRSGQIPEDTWGRHDARSAATAHTAHRRGRPPVETTGHVCRGHDLEQGVVVAEAPDPETSRGRLRSSSPLIVAFHSSRHPHRSTPSSANSSDTGAAGCSAGGDDAAPSRPVYSRAARSAPRPQSGVRVNSKWASGESTAWSPEAHSGARQCRSTHPRAGPVDDLLADSGHQPHHEEDPDGQRHANVAPRTARDAELAAPPDHPGTTRRPPVVSTRPRSRGQPWSGPRSNRRPRSIRGRCRAAGGEQRHPGASMVGTVRLSSSMAAAAAAVFPTRAAHSTEVPGTRLGDSRPRSPPVRRPLGAGRGSVAVLARPGGRRPPRGSAGGGDGFGAGVRVGRELRRGPGMPARSDPVENGPTAHEPPPATGCAQHPPPASSAATLRP